MRAVRNSIHSTTVYWVPGTDLEAMDTVVSK